MRPRRACWCARPLVAGAWIATAACMALVAWRATDPAAAVAASEPGEAFKDSADRHLLAGRFLAATAMMDRFERTIPRTTADFEGAYATALGNAALEARVERGLAIPATRSSIERVALLRNALGRVVAGEHKSAQPGQMRDLRVVRAGMLVIWGFAREAYHEYWSAHDAQPLDPRVAGEAAWLEARFTDPVSNATGRPPAGRSSP